MMEHDDAQQLLPAYVDQELDVVDALAVARHLETCLECRREVDEQRSVSRRTRAGAARFEAPPALLAQVLATPPAQRPSRAQLSGANWWRTASAALAASLALALAWGIDEYRVLPSAQQRLTEELVTNHVRSLQVDHLTDVASTDQHTVKPWFIGKLDFSPPVVDLAPQGFPLVGGRLDYLGGHDVAVLVYRHNRHPINLYVWPAAGAPAAPLATQVHGYHLARWSAGGMDFAAVSDAADGSLPQFVALLRR
jgi:anti-sigma factor RsiW